MSLTGPTERCAFSVTAYETGGIRGEDFESECQADRTSLHRCGGEVYQLGGWVPGSLVPKR